MLRRIYNYFTPQERLLWGISAGAILLSFFLLDGRQYLTLAASLIGVTSIIVNAKGNPLGQLLMVIFSLFYGYISYACAYYGEMVTYLGMTGPMAALALISWLRHPFHGNRAQVQVNHISRREHGLLALLTAGVTLGFYFILRALGTANLLPSTVSVVTSFWARCTLRFAAVRCFPWAMRLTTWCSLCCGCWPRWRMCPTCRWWCALRPFWPTISTDLSAGAGWRKPRLGPDPDQFKSRFLPQAHPCGKKIS